MIYDITNPSDAYTIVADDLKVAAVACLLLGNGQYGFEPLEKGGERVPIFLFGGSDKWFTEKFDQDVETAVNDVVGNRAKELIDCFESCLIGGLHDRHEYDLAIGLIESEENKAEFRAKRHDDRRSSLNNIGGRAYKMAANLREKIANPIIQAPKQVLAG